MVWAALKFGLVDPKTSDVQVGMGQQLSWVHWVKQSLWFVCPFLHALRSMPKLKETYTVYSRAKSVLPMAAHKMQGYF